MRAVCSFSTASSSFSLPLSPSFLLSLSLTLTHSQFLLVPFFLLGMTFSWRFCVLSIIRVMVVGNYYRFRSPRLKMALACALSAILHRESPQNVHYHYSSIFHWTQKKFVVLNSMNELILYCPCVSLAITRNFKFGISRMLWIHARLMTLSWLKVWAKPTVVKRWYQFENRLKFIHPLSVGCDWRFRWRWRWE